MGWVFVTIILLLFVLVPGFRVFALGLFGLIVVVTLIDSGRSQRAEREAEREAAASLKRISREEIQLSDFKLSKSAYKHQISGRIKNNSSKFTLSELGLKITLKDCIEDTSSTESKCDIVGQSDTAIDTTVPPGQARDFSRNVDFDSETRIRGKLSWYYTVSYIKAN